MFKPQYPTPAPGVMKFTNLVDPSMVIIILYLVLSIYVQVLNEYFNFIFLAQNLSSLEVGPVGVHLQVLVSLPYRCYIPNLIKIGLVVLEKVVNAKCTTGDNSYKPITGHLIYSGDLNKGSIKHFYTLKVFNLDL